MDIPDDWYAEAAISTIPLQGRSYEAGPPERINLPPSGELALSDVRPPRRAPGVPGLVRERAVALLGGFQSKTPLPPIVAYAVPDPPFAYRLGEGYHRYYLSLAVGFTHVPAVILTYWEPWMTGDE